MADVQRHEELVRRVQSRRVCEDCGANVDAFEHKADALPDLCQHTEQCRANGPKWVARSDDSEAVVRERLAALAAASVRLQW